MNVSAKILKKKKKKKDPTERSILFKKCPDQGGFLSGI